MKDAIRYGRSLTLANTTWTLRGMLHGDIDLYRSWLDGDASAGAQLVDRHHRALICWIAKRVDSLHTACDISHDVWLGVMRGGYAGHGAFRAWLTRIARTQVARHYRQRARNPELSLATWTSPTAQLIRSEVRVALDELSNSDQREAMQLRFFSDLSTTEVAKRVGAPENTVRSRIRLATAKLRARL